MSKVNETQSATAESPADLDRRLKELEREKREEELRQLKANAKIRLVTPAVMAAMLPLLAGFGVWLVNEVKQFNEGYQALKERDQLRKEKENLKSQMDDLRSQKDSLNIEIPTLLELKKHYADQAKELQTEVETRQKAMDTAYLRAVFYSFESEYALGHVKAFGPALTHKVIADLEPELAKLPKEPAEKIRKALDDNLFMLDMINASQKSMGSFRKALNLVPASDWARQLNANPSGAVLAGRDLMSGGTSERGQYYDVVKGDFLTPEEVKAIK